MKRTGLKRIGSTVGFTIGVIAVAMVLTAALGWEAWQADRKHRETARLILHDYARTAAAVYLDRIVYDLTFVPGAFGPLEGLRLASTAQLPALTAMLPHVDTLAPCQSATGESRFYFRLDLRTGALTTSGAIPNADILNRVRDSVTGRLTRTPPQGWYIAPMFRGSGTGSRALIYVAVRDLSGRPMGAYGFETCNSALWEQVFRGSAAKRLLPSTIAGGLHNDSILSLDVAAMGQFTGRYRTAGQFRDAYSVEVYMQDNTYSHHQPLTQEARGTIRVELAINPAMAGEFVIGGLPRSRLPMLGFLLLLTGGVLVLAIRQLMRERELLRLRADFTSSVSHELRTPLAEILLFAETLEMDRVENEAERRDAIQVVVQEARHLAHIVDNVLHLSRAERRLLQPRLEPTNLAGVIRETTASFAPLATGYGMHLAVSVDDTIEIMVHQGILRQILLNLLDNAAKYGPPGQSITVAAELEGEHAIITVDDEGPGISAKDRQRIWEPFVRLETESGIAGSGIGLAVVRELTLAHRGDCWSETTEKGGARFVVRFPGRRTKKAAEAGAAVG